MNYVIKLGVITGVVVTFGTLVGQLVPVTLTANVNSAIIYFLGFLNYLNWLVHASVLFNVIQMLFTYFVGVLTFLFLYWIVGFFR